MDRNRLISVFSAPAVIAVALTTTVAAKPSASRPASAGDRANIIAYSIDSDGPDFSAVVTGRSATTGPR